LRIGFLAYGLLGDGARHVVVGVVFVIVAIAPESSVAGADMRSLVSFTRRHD
jgi:hypothetical protein